MAQLIGVVIILVIGKLIVDYVKDYKLPKKSTAKKGKSGEVIDLSDAWINTSSLPYQLKDSALNNRESAVYYMVFELIHNSPYIVNMNTRMSDVLTLPAQTSNYQEYLRRIKERTFDLVIFEQQGLRPVLVINVGGQKDHKKQQIANQFRDNVLAAAGLRSITIDPYDNWDHELLIQKFRSAGLKLEGSARSERI